MEIQVHFDGFTVILEVDVLEAHQTGWYRGYDRPLRKQGIFYV